MFFRAIQVMVIKTRKKPVVLSLTLTQPLASWDIVIRSRFMKLNPRVNVQMPSIPGHDMLLSAFALTVQIQFSLIISFW
jgi:hypothetical protein